MEFTGGAGKTLSMKLVRAGRAMNAGVYFVTQNTDDLLDEKLKNNLGLKFAFRSTDMNEIKKDALFRRGRRGREQPEAFA